MTKICKYTGLPFEPHRPDQVYSDPTTKHRHAYTDALRKFGPTLVRIVETPGALKAFTEWSERYFESPCAGAEGGSGDRVDLGSQKGRKALERAVEG